MTKGERGIRLLFICLAFLALQGCGKQAKDYLVEGHAFTSANQPQKAEASFQDGIMAYPEDYAISTALLDLYMRSEQWDKVEKYMLVAPADRMDSSVVVLAYRGLAKRLLAEKQWSEAAAQLVRAGERGIAEGLTKGDSCPLQAIDDYMKAAASASKARDVNILSTIGDRLLTISLSPDCKSPKGIMDYVSGNITGRLNEAARPESNDMKGWETFLTAIAKQNMDGVPTKRPYLYFVPSDDDAKSIAGRDDQLENVQITVSRGVLPGNMLVFGGPDSRTTAELVIKAFEGAESESFASVVILFIGDEDDSQSVKAALRLSKAEYRFAEM